MTKLLETGVAAHWILPATGQVVPNAEIVVRDGLIAELKPMAAPPEGGGTTIVLPGLVNAHTHLDLSTLRIPVTAKKPVDWLHRVVQARTQDQPGDAAQRIHAGVLELLDFGVTLVGDISSGGLTSELFPTLPMWGVVFHEILGLSDARGNHFWQQMIKRLHECPATDNWQWGISPHAPYSTHRQLIEAAARLDIGPVCIHLAEFSCEKSLLEENSGELARFLQEINLWHPANLAPHWEWIRWKLRRASQAIYVHANYLPRTPDFHHNEAVIYCPRTHQAFGHPKYPLSELLQAQVTVALGTDSHASTPNLDPLAEACLVRQQFPDIPPEMILQMITRWGAEMLGFAHRTGSLEVGKSADLVMIQAPTRLKTADEVYHFLFSGAAIGLPRTTMWRGKWRRRE